jgi:hypothetical protein
MGYTSRHDAFEGNLTHGRVDTILFVGPEWSIYDDGAVRTDWELDEEHQGW